MDTKEKNRESARQPEAAQQRRQRPEGGQTRRQRPADADQRRQRRQEQTAQEQDPRKQAGARTSEEPRQPERRSRQEEARQRERPRQAEKAQQRQHPRQQEETQQSQRLRRAEDTQQAQRPRRAEDAQQRPARSEENTQTERPRKRPVQDGAARRESPASRPAQRQGEVPISVPRGTGPRKSAPQLNEQQTQALRRQMQSKAPARRPQQKRNALQDFISGIRGGKSEKRSGEDAAQMAQRRRLERSERAEKKRQRDQRNDTPAVIYTQPTAFNRDRLLIQLLTVTAVVAALVLGMSVFFKVKTIMISGVETYSAWTVREASGISEGDGLLTFSKTRAIAKIHASLPYVDDVRIGIKLPDTVIIYIEEMAVSYAVESTQGDWWLINSDGRVVEQTTANAASSHTKVLGVKLDSPIEGNDAVAANDVPQETLESGEAVPQAVTGAQRLSSALQILKALEANDIVGQAASVDVSSLEDVTLWYGSRYEVMLGDTANMEYKIACMNDAILDLSEYQSGILDISFRTWPDQVGYTPFG